MIARGFRAGHRSPTWLAMLGLLLLWSERGTAETTAGDDGAQRLHLQRTQPDHFKGLPPGALPLPEPSMLVPPRLESRPVYRFPGPLREFARHRPDLAELCRLGAFQQQLDGIFYAATPERRYGVGFGSGANLYDIARRRDKMQVYFFANQDTSRCDVYTAKLADVMDHALYRNARIP